MGFNIPVSEVDRSSRQRANEERVELRCTLDWLYKTGFFKKFHPVAEEYTFFWIAHGTVFRIDNKVYDNIHLNKLKKYKSYKTSFSEIYNKIKLKSVRKSFGTF